MTVHLAVTLVLGMTPTQTSAVVPAVDQPLMTCADQRLKPEIEGLLRPVLVARARAIKEKRYHTKEYVEAFYTLLDTPSLDAMEAQVALMAYSLGDHYAGALLTAALGHPRRTESLVASYAACRPAVSFEAELKGLTATNRVYREYRRTRLGNVL